MFYRCYTLVHTFSLDFFDIQRGALCTKEVYEGTILRQQNGFKQGSEVRLITSASYSRRPFMSLMRERIILQLQLTGQGVNDGMQECLHFFAGSGNSVNVQLVFPSHAVDLRDRIMPVQYLCDL